MTTIEPQKRYFLIERMCTISTPMLSGTSIPSSARITHPNHVHWPEWMLQFQPVPPPPDAEWPETISQRMPASPITKIAAPQKTTAQIAYVSVMGRCKSVDMSAENQSTA